LLALDLGVLVLSILNRSILNPEQIMASAHHSLKYV
jgi:hypothetical protein